MAAPTDLDDGQQDDDAAPTTNSRRGLVPADWIGWVAAILGLVLAVASFHQMLVSTSSAEHRARDRVWSLRRQAMTAANHHFTGAVYSAAAVRSSRYVANLSDTCEGWVISVRDVVNSPVHSPPVMLYSVFPGRSSFPVVQRLSLRLQVLYPRESSVDRLIEFASDVTAEDDTGRRLTCGSEERTAGFTGGWTRLVRLSPPSPHAQYLRSIDGYFTLARAGSHSRRLRFRIVNVPLPVCNHVFGVAGATLLRALPSLSRGGDSVSLSNGAKLMGYAASAQMADCFPPHYPEPGPVGEPPRLVMHPGAPYRFPLYLRREPSTALSVPIDAHITAVPEAAGGIRARIALRAGEHEFHVETRFWDAEPAVIVAPAACLLRDAPHDSYVAVRVLLYLDPTRPEPVDAVPVGPYPVASGGRGGIVEGAVLVGSEPAAFGGVTIRVSRIDGIGNALAAADQNLALNREGSWRFVNMAPGTYRLTIVRARHYVCVAVRELSWDEYVRRRYGIRRPVWAPETQVVTVRPGGITSAAPWRVVERRASGRKTAEACAPSGKPASRADGNG